MTSLRQLTDEEWARMTPAERERKARLDRSLLELTHGPDPLMPADEPAAVHNRDDSGSGAHDATHSTTARPARSPIVNLDLKRMVKRLRAMPPVARLAEIKRLRAILERRRQELAAAAADAEAPR
jgi:hypothetical protein